MTGAIPRRPSAAIVIAFQAADNTIVALAPFYVGVSGGRNARVVTPRHTGVPRRGWVAAGRKLGPTLSAHKLAPELLTLMRRFTATTYDGALLLDCLAPLGYPASSYAVARTLKNYHSNLAAYTNPSSVRAVVTRSQHMSPFSRGDRVFARLDDTWYQATVRMVKRDGTLSISYVAPGLDDDDPHVSMKPEADVRPDIAHMDCEMKHARSSTPGAHRDPEEDEDEFPARTAAHLTECGAADCDGAAADHPSRTFLDVLGEIGEYTALLEAIFGHEDHFGSSGVASLIENKLLIPRGAPHPTLRLSEVAAMPQVPLGALAIPRCKVWTLIGAMQDVELHELHERFHAGRSAAAAAVIGVCSSGPAAAAAEGGEAAAAEEGGGAAAAEEGGEAAPAEEGLSCSHKAKKRRKTRAAKSELKAATYTSHRVCWVRNAADTDGLCYLEGVGVADWQSKYY